MDGSKKFARIIVKRGLSNFAAALELKVSPSTVHYWLHGSSPRKRHRQRLAVWSKGEIRESDPWTAAA